MTVFGALADGTATLHMPVSSCTWKIGDIASNGKYSTITLFSFSQTDMEAVDIRRCFNEVTHIFAFGRNIKETILNVSLICFIGKQCDQESSSGYEDIQKIREEYEKKRIYKNTTALDVTIGDKITMSGYLIGMNIGNVDAGAGTALITFTILPKQDV